MCWGLGGASFGHELDRRHYWIYDGQSRQVTNRDVKLQALRWNGAGGKLKSLRDILAGSLRGAAFQLQSFVVRHSLFHQLAP